MVGPPPRGVPAMSRSGKNEVMLPEGEEVAPSIAEGPPRAGVVGAELVPGVWGNLERC